MAPEYTLADKYKEVICIKAGENTSVSIPFSGFPTPKATWLHNDSELDKTRMSVDCSADVMKINFKNVKRSDSGEYKLYLENSAGKVDVTITLKVLGNYLTYYLQYSLLFVATFGNKTFISIYLNIKKKSFNTLFNASINYLTAINALTLHF